MYTNILNFILGPFFLILSILDKKITGKSVNVGSFRTIYLEIYLLIYFE